MRLSFTNMYGYWEPHNNFFNHYFEKLLLWILIIYGIANYSFT